jgi:glucose-6-phosphate dehydrogenase assembly protein OpcA
MRKVTTPKRSEPTPVALRDVERELSRRQRAVQGPGDNPVVRACMSNLIIYCDRMELADTLADAVPDIVTTHPARVLLLVAESGPGDEAVRAGVCVRGHVVDPGRWVISEQVTLHARGHGVEGLPSAVRALIIGDLPTNLWWAVPQPPPLAGVVMHELADTAQQIIYDSIGWPAPARGVVATGAWLEQIESQDRTERWRVASDLNWRRLKYWRRLVAQALDPEVAPGALESITDVLLEHGPHAVVQAWELVSWLASRLGWHVQTGQVEPNVEIAWQMVAAHGPVRVRIRRLADGPSELRRVRVACTLDGTPGAIDVTVEDGHHLAAVLEGRGGAARTVIVPPMTLSELIVRQLSDRERDPIFRESMAVARVLAQSVVGHG